MNGKKIGAEPKVAVLRIPADHWNAMSPQQQLGHIMAQMIAFMSEASFFATMDGLCVQVIDPNDIAACKVILQVGQQPARPSGLITN